LQYREVDWINPSRYVVFVVSVTIEEINYYTLKREKEMKSVILNMMILGIASSLTAEDASALPPPPPPPSPSSSLSSLFSISSSSISVLEPVDITELMESSYEELNEFLDEKGVNLTANLLNLYLMGNKEKISEGISAGEISMRNLNKRLTKDLKQLNDLAPDSPVAEEFVALFENLQKNLTELTAKTYRESTDSYKTFKKINNQIEGIAQKYFDKVINSGNEIKKLSDLTALKDAEVVLERAVVLSSSFCDLANLSQQSKNELFSETAAKDAISLLNLKRLISERLTAIDGETTKNSIKLPTNSDISEKDFLTRALNYINETCEGNDQLQKLLDLRDILNHKYTIVESNVDNNADPMIVIRALSDRISEVGDLLKLANTPIKNNRYSQFGRMFTEGDSGYGGALIRSVNSWISEANSLEFDASKMRNLFRSKELKGEIVSEYIHLLTVYMNLCKSFSKSTINLINGRKKFKVTSYVSKAKKNTTAKEEERNLLEIRSKDAKLGTSSDPKQYTNNIFFSRLRKNCESYVKEISKAKDDIRDIPDTMKKIQSISNLSKEKDIANYINNIISHYLGSGNDFEKIGDQIVIEVKNKKDGTLSEEDIPNIVFALAQNCDSVRKSSLSLFPTSSSKENSWVLEMAKELSKNLKSIISVINEQKIQGLSDIIKKLNNLKNSIDVSIDSSDLNKAKRYDSAIDISDYQEEDDSID
jgi:hypothetical protein